MKIDDWKLKARTDEELSERIDKFFTIDIAAKEDESREITFVISAGNVDRDGDIINPDGWDFSAWVKNPVVLWGHDYGSLPVANGKRVWVENGKVYATAKFIEPEVYPFADVIYKMLVNGYLRTVSVGFNPSEYEWIEDGIGIHFMKQELLEFSVVSVPANPEALIAAGKKENPELMKAYAKGLKEFAEGILKEGTEIDYKEKTFGTGVCPHCGEKFKMYAESSFIEFFGVSFEDVEEAKKKRTSPKVKVVKGDNNEKIGEAIKRGVMEALDYEEMRRTGKVK